MRYLSEQKLVADVVSIMTQHEDKPMLLQAAYALVLCLLLQGKLYSSLINFFFTIHGHNGGND